MKRHFLSSRGKKREHCVLEAARFSELGTMPEVARTASLFRVRPSGEININKSFSFARHVSGRVRP